MTGSEKKLMNKLENGGTKIDNPIGFIPFSLKDGTPCDGIAAVYNGAVHIFADGKETDTYPLSGITEMKAEADVGSFSVTAIFKDGSEKLICTSFSTGVSNAAAVVKRCNYFIANGFVPSGRFERPERVCPKCGRPYAKGSTICFRCSKKSESIKRLLGIAKGYKRYIALSMFLFGLVTAVSLISPSVNRILVDEYIKADIPKPMGGFAFIILSLLLLQVLQRFFSYLRGKCLIISGNKIIVRIRDMVFRKINRLSIGSVSEHSVGQLMKRITGDADVIRRFIADQLAGILEQVLTLAVVAIIIVAYDWRLAILIILPTPFMAVTFKLFINFMRRMHRIRWHLGAQGSATLHDVFSGIRVVKAYGTEKREEARYDKYIAREKDVQIRQEKAWAVFMPIFEFCMGIGELVILYFVGSKILSHEMTLGQMSQFTAYTGMVYGPIRTLSRLPNTLTQFTSSLAMVFDIIDEDEDVADIPDAVTPEITGEIVFDNVSFGYDDAVDVLRDVNLHIKAGEFIGLVGPSGAGKSTVINLVMRLYDAADGKITVDGTDIKNFNQEYYRNNIGVVLQETFLFSGSVYQNIAYARPDASRDEIIEAAKTAGAHDFIMRMPDGYDTYIGEHGYTLSGGERQRISIARALLKHPKILILDEATSALDTETEKNVQDAIEILSENCTTIAIAHRLSTLRNATRLVVLDRGRIVETGTHDELMSHEGLYRDLVLAQREMSKARNEGPPPRDFGEYHGQRRHGRPQM